MNEEAIKDAYSLFANTGYNGSYDDFKQLIQSNPEARSDAYGLFTGTGYDGSQQDFDSLMGIGTSEPVKKKEESVPLWLQKQEQAKPKPEQTLPFLESKPSGISLGSQRVPETAPMFEAPPMRTPEEAQAIVETPEYKETPYFTGTFGQLLRNMESPWNPAWWIADKIDDFGRAIGQGSSTGDIIGPTSKIFLNGDKTSDEDIEKFRKASEMADRLGPSDEMMSFSKEYQESGKDVTGFLKALAMNPGAIPEIMVSSYTAMVNAPSLKAGSAVVGTAAAGGAVAAGPAGAGAAALASVPYAMAAMGATLETNLSLAESIKDKLAQDGLEWNDENIKSVISDEKFLKDARIKAVTRGVTIGAIDALTGRIAGKVGAKLLKAPKGGVVKSAVAAGSIEAAGGSTGEATARALTGQEMDIAEIGLEGIAELPGTVVSVGSEVLRKPLYKVNGEIRPEADVKEIVETADGDQLAKINIEITNDDKGYNEQIQEKVVSAQVKKEVKEVNPDLDEETANEITRLEMQRKKFEGKKTQSAKDKLASINSQIKTLQENAVQKPSTEESVLRAEESQVGLQEVGEGNAQVQAPAEEVVQEEVTTYVPTGDQNKIIEETVGNAQKGTLNTRWADWFLGESKEAKSYISDDISKNKKLQDAMKSRLYDEWKKINNSDISFEDFLNSEIELFRGGVEGDRNETNVDGFNSWELTEEGAKKFAKGNPVRKVKKKVKDLYGLADIVGGEFEVLEPTQLSEDYAKMVLESQEMTDKMFDNLSRDEQKKITELSKNNKYNKALSLANDLLKNKTAVTQEEVVTPDAEVQAEFDRISIPEDTEAVSPATPTLSEESQKVKTQLEDFQNAFDEAYNTEYPKSGTAQQKRSATAKSKKAVKKLQQMMGFDIGAYWELDANQTKKREALYSLRENKDYDSYDQMVAAYQKDVAEGNQSELVTSINTLLGIAPIEIEAVSPATPVVAPIGEVSIESAFDEDGEIDYDAEEAVKEIARARNLGITRDRELATVAKDEDGNIIGGAFTSYDNETGEYTFDVVVSEGAEGSGVGSKLLNSVIEIPSDIKEFNPKAKVKVDVVNPQMQAMLEKRGFEVTAKTGTDRVTMEKAKPKKKVSSKTQGKTTFIKKPRKINDNLYEFEDAIGVGYIAKKQVGEDAKPRWIVIDSPESFEFDHTPFTSLKDAVNYVEQSNRKVSEMKAKSVPIPVAIPKPAVPAPKPAAKSKRFLPPLPSIDKNEVDKTAKALEGNQPEKLIDLYDPLNVIVGEEENKAQAERIIDIEINLLPDYIKFSTSEGQKKRYTDRLEYLSNEENRQKEISDLFNNLQDSEKDRIKNASKSVAEAYQRAKKNGSNPKLVSAVEKIINKPAPKPVAVVLQPTTKAVGPDALRQEYIDKTAEVRLNKDKSRTQKQIEERVAELRAEYQKLKAEMTAPRPKAEPEAKPVPKKAAPAKKVEAKEKPVVKSKFQQAQDFADKLAAMSQEERDDVEFDENYRGYQLFEARKAMPKTPNSPKFKKVDENNSSTLYSDYEYIANIDGEPYGLMKYEDPDDPDNDKAFVWAYEKVGTDDVLETMIFDNEELIKEIKSQISKEVKTTPKEKPTSVVEEEGPSYEDIKDLDVSDPTLLETVEDFLDYMDDGLENFGRGNLSSGIAIPAARLIIKALKALVRAGITLQEAIKRVAAENNLEIKDIVNMIKDIENSQSPMVKLKSQIQNEIQAVKDGARNANEAVQAIVKYFNFNAERGNLTRRDLGRVINAIAKVKDQKSLDKAADKIFDIIKKAKTDIIEVSDAKSRNIQIRLEARAALGAKKDINQKRKDLSNTIKEMETTGKISAAKAKAILNKIGKVNLDNPAAVETFLDYVENVLEDAAYEVELAGINAKLGKAKNNVNKKIGTAKNLTPLLNRLFNIKPSLIPAEVFDAYKELIDMFGDSAAVLDLAEITEVTQQAQDILNQIDDQLSTIPALATKLFNYGKGVLDEDGALDYSATIEKMLADEVIDEAEYKLMKKYKSLILPRAVKIPKTKQELADEKKVLVTQVKKAASEATISELASDDEKKMASNIIKLAKTDAVEALDNRQLENLLKIFDNFSNGYFPAYANGLSNDLIAGENATFLSKAIAKAKMPSLASVKLKLRNKRQALFAKVKSIPLFNIDEIFGDFKTKDIFNSIFNSLAQNQQRYALEIEKISQRLEDALNKIAKTYNNNENKIVESKMKMAIYRIQREFESNPGDPSVNPAIEYINKTIEAIREGDTNYSEEDADMLEQIAKDYSDGNDGIDTKKLEKSFNSAEKEALNLFDEINKEVEGKAVFTGDVIRGDKVRLLNNYNHINVLPAKGKESDPIADVMSKFDPKNVVSTKAKSLIERSSGAKPINFDIFSTVQRGAKFVLMDYYLTNPIRIARKTVNTTAKMMEENGTLNEGTKTILNVVKDAMELSLKASLDQAAFRDTFAEKVIQEMAKTGYRSMLGGLPRATTEFTSNMAYIAMVAPTEWTAGVKMMKNIDGGKAVSIMKAVGSKAIIRTYGSDPLKGRLVDPSVLSKRVGIGASKLKGETLNVIATIHNNTTKKVKNSAEFVADTLISTPDKIMMRPLWFGSFEKAFEDFSGKKPDLDKIADNDADYMIKNKESLEAAGRVADEKVVMAGDVDNPYMNSLRTYIPSDASGLAKTFKVFDNFMLKFQIRDYLNARRGIHAMMGNGNISKAQGARLMAAVVTRMTVYTVMGKMAAEFMYGLFLDDEDDDDDKTFAQKLGQGLSSTFTSLLFGRDYGNSIRSVVNYGVEKVNEKYLDFLRDGEYDPYEDAIQYTFIPPEKKGKSLEAFDIIANISGPYSPAVKSLNFVTKKLTEEPKKEAAAIERQEKEKNIRVPLEILGNLGYVPLYKDIRAIVNKSIYSELDKELDKQGQKGEEFKPMGMNKTDLKRYYPEIYEQYYGAGSEAEAKRKLEYEKNLLERKMKDDYYNYVPKQRPKKGFGGKEFGSGSSKKGGGFGSKGFGK